MSITQVEFAEDCSAVFNGVRLHYRVAGDPQASPVVILHGIMGHGREWDVLTAALAPAHQVVVLDQRGHGRSAWASDYTAATMSTDLLTVIDGLALDRPAVVGHSLGAMVAMLAAAARPETISRLVVLDAGPDTISGEMAADLAAFMRALATARYDTVDAAVAEWSQNPLADPAHLRHYVTHALAPGQDGRWRWMFDGIGLNGFSAGVSETQLWAAVDAITCPTLIVRGQHSPALSPGTADEMLRRLPDGRLAVIPGAAHDLGVEQPTAVAEVVSAFLVTGHPRPEEGNQ